jgi:hypothetical protein
MLRGSSSIRIRVCLRPADFLTHAKAFESERNGERKRVVKTEQRKSAWTSQKKGSPSIETTAHATSEV